MGSLRGPRAEGRHQAVSPYELRRQVEVMDRAVVLGRFALVGDMEGLIGAYRPLVMDLGADRVALQVRSLDPLETIRLAGEIVLPALRAAIAPEGTSTDPTLRRNDLIARMDSRSTGGGNDGDPQN